MEAYGSLRYAETVSHLGEPMWLSRAGGAMLRRRIPGTDLFDLVGPYPWAGFADWSALGSDLGAHSDSVTATVVVSPLSTARDDSLRSAFPDRLVTFKSHYLVDLTGDHHSQWSASHRRKVRRGCGGVVVGHLAPSEVASSRWVELYSHLRARHSIEGSADFCADALSDQLELPGMEIFAATVASEIVGMACFLRDGRTAAYHLAAYSPKGYEKEVSYAIFPLAFDMLAGDGVEVVNLGGAAGLIENPDDGLARFKRGWATMTEPALLGGRVLDRRAFDSLGDPGGAGYWPPYRSPGGVR